MRTFYSFAAPSSSGALYVYFKIATIANSPMHKRSSYIIRKVLLTPMAISRDIFRDKYIPREVETHKPVLQESMEKSSV